MSYQLLYLLLSYRSVADLSNRKPSFDGLSNVKSFQIPSGFFSQWAWLWTSKSSRLWALQPPGPWIFNPPLIWIYRAIPYHSILMLWKCISFIICSYVVYTKCVSDTQCSPLCAPHSNVYWPNQCIHNIESVFSITVKIDDQNRNNDKFPFLTMCLFRRLWTVLFYESSSKLHCTTLLCVHNNQFYQLH